MSARALCCYLARYELREAEENGSERGSDGSDRGDSDDDKGVGEGIGEGGGACRDRGGTRAEDGGGKDGGGDGGDGGDGAGGSSVLVPVALESALPSAGDPSTFESVLHKDAYVSGRPCRTSDVCLR